jgi:hypothetical protein
MENRAWHEPTERFSHFVDLSLKKTITPNIPWSEPSAFQPVDQRGFLEPEFFHAVRIVVCVIRPPMKNPG